MGVLKLAIRNRTFAARIFNEAELVTGLQSDNSEALMPVLAAAWRERKADNDPVGADMLLALPASIRRAGLRGAYKYTISDLRTYFTSPPRDFEEMEEVRFYKREGRQRKTSNRKHKHRPNTTGTVFSTNGSSVVVDFEGGRQTCAVGEELQHLDFVNCTRENVNRARRHAITFKPGERPPAMKQVELATVSGESFDHFLDFAMSSEVTEVLKGSERNSQYNHVLSLQQKRNQLYPVYVVEAERSKVKPITREMMYFLLGDGTFVDLKEETCMCNLCKKLWWTAQKEGLSIIDAIASHSYWKSTDAKECRSRDSMKDRLTTWYTFERCERRRHLQTESSDSGHCVQHQTNCALEPRLRTNCTHNDASGNPPSPPEKVTEWNALCQYCGKGGKKTANCEYCHFTLHTGGCLHSHVAETGGHPSELIPDFSAGDKFVCTECQHIEVDCANHTSECGKCNEIFYFAEDLTNLSSLLPDDDEGNALRKRVVAFLPTMAKFDAHMVRDGVQAPYRFQKLAELRRNNDWTKIYALHDFWRKLDAQGPRWAQCETRPQVSMEGWVVMGVIPPPDTPGVDWSKLPLGAREVVPNGDGFRGFWCEIIHLANDDTTQGFYQTFCNEVAVLRLLHERHPFIKTCCIQSDGAKNYNAHNMIAFVPSLGRLTGIHVEEWVHNEPGHGSDIGDMYGACCKAGIRSDAIGTGNDVDTAAKANASLDRTAVKGSMSREIKQNPDLAFSASSTFKEVGIMDMLWKTFPTEGEFKGGVVFRRYYVQGSDGIGYTEKQVRAIQGLELPTDFEVLSLRSEERELEEERGRFANDSRGGREQREDKRVTLAQRRGENVDWNRRAVWNLPAGMDFESWLSRNKRRWRTKWSVLTFQVRSLRDSF